MFALDKGSIKPDDRIDSIIETMPIHIYVHTKGKRKD